MAPAKWERAKEKFTDFFEYGYDRAVRRSPDARSAYQERVQARERYWVQQEELRARQRFEDLQRREADIQKFLDDKLPLIPPSTDGGEAGDGGAAAVRVYVPTGSPFSVAGGGRAQDAPRVVVTSPSGTRRRTDDGRVARPRGYFVRPGRRRAPSSRYTASLGPLSEQDEEGSVGGRAGGDCPTTRVPAEAKADAGGGTNANPSNPSESDDTENDEAGAMDGSRSTGRAGAGP